jgi:hypothetical protein
MFRNLFIGLGLFAVHSCYAQLAVEYIHGKHEFGDGIYEEGWREIRSISPRPIIPGGFSFSGKYIYFDERCTRQVFGTSLKFFCNSPKREWIADIGMALLPGQKIIFTKQINYYGCVIGDVREAINTIASSMELPRLNKMDKMLSARIADQEIVISYVHNQDGWSGPLNKLIPVCQNPGFIKIRLQRLNTGMDAVADAVYSIRLKESQKPKSAFVP